MALIVTSITPSHNSINIPLDSKIQIIFNQEIDPFTVHSGISIYTLSDSTWSGPDLSILDTKYDEVTSIGDNYIYYDFSYTIDGNILNIELTKPLIQDRKHYISIYPGNNATRFLSSKTVESPVYTRIGSSAGIVNITSPYIGSNNSSFEILVTDINTVNVSKSGSFLGSFEFIEGQEINIGELKFSITGSFDIGDLIDIDVFAAVGCSVLYKSEFVTNKYLISAPVSNNITNTNLLLPEIVATIPEDLSVNNDKVNPIIIKFNKNIDNTQDMSDKIKITKINIDTNKKRNITYYYKIENNILKIYMLNAENLS